MNYGEMSDSRVAAKVARYKFGKDQIIYKDPDNANAVLCHGILGNFDPCNNPSDAWPIIVENNISIIRTSRDWMATWSEYGAHMAVNDIYATHEKPFVAAMICFLEMKDAENAN